MILQALRALAESERLVDDPAFESKGVRWIIDLDVRGRFQQAYDTHQPEPVAEGVKKKPKLRPKLMSIPRRQIRPGKQTKPDFLVDKAMYALGFAAEGDDPVAPRFAECKASFAALIRETESQEQEVQSVLHFLEDPNELLACSDALRAKGGFSSNDLFAFRVDGLLLTELDSLMAWWGHRHHAANKDGRPAQCLVCGEVRVPARLHNSFQIRGASTSGIPLVSFNAPAFEKYGLEGNENAPVCNPCMTAYSEALRRLTRVQYEAPGNRQLRPLSTGLSGDTTAVYWAEGQGELASKLNYFAVDPNAVRALLLSPHAGQSFVLQDPSRFFCLIVTGAQGRVSIRRLHTATVGEVASNLRSFFRHTNVARRDMEAPLPLLRMMQAMVLKGEKDRMPAELGTGLWLHALFSDPLPRSLLAAVIARNRAERAVPAGRAALLHLYFAGQKKLDVPMSQDIDEEMEKPMSLDVESKDPPYLLGRLLAALERVQTTAQGNNLNRTLIDRTFGAASTRPGVVFPQLIQTAQHHLTKAGRERPGSEFHLNRLLGEIMDGLQADGFSAVLHLEEQGRFALGYYHQRQSFFPKKAQGAEATTEETTL